MPKFNYRFERNPLLRIENGKIYYSHSDDDWFKPETFTEIQSLFDDNGCLYIFSINGECEIWQFVFDEKMPYLSLRSFDTTHLKLS